MKYLKIKLEDNKSVLVDSSTEIENKDWYWDENKLKVKHYFESRESFPSLIHRFKIIATINHSIDLDVPMVIVKHEVEELAEHSSEVQEATYTPPHKTTYKHGFIDGYKAKQEEGTFSEEDLTNAVLLGINLQSSNNDPDKLSNEEKVKGFIQSLKQKYISLKQEYIELEMETSYLDWKKGDKEKLSDTLQIRTDRVDGQLMAYIKSKR